MMGIISMLIIVLGLEMQDISLSISRTIAIEHIPRQLCTKENIMAHFKEIYPNFKILVRKYPNLIKL
jgi:hypothetical protein